MKLYDFAIIGEVEERNDCDQVQRDRRRARRRLGRQRLWIQHTKVGLWLDGPFDGFTVQSNRILDQTADGLNLHQGISHVTVDNNFLRNTGDDGLAMWSEHQADHDNTFSHNTVLLPILANNIAIYGGHDNTVSDNVVADTQTRAAASTSPTGSARFAGRHHHRRTQHHAARRCARPELAVRRRRAVVRRPRRRDERHGRTSPTPT